LALCFTTYVVTKKYCGLSPIIIRESQGLTQEEFTARCNLLEWNINRSTLAKIESQVRRITDEEAALLAKALRVKISELYK